MTSPMPEPFNTDRGDGSAAAWMTFEKDLTSYLGSMTEDDTLTIELAGSGDPEAGCLPYAQFRVHDDGNSLRCEIVGNAYLAAGFDLGDDGCELLELLGWKGNDESAPNWFLDIPTAKAHCPAQHMRIVFSHHFHVAHPHLLSYSASGSAAENIAVLGLAATADVPTEDFDDRHEAPAVFTPSGRAELCSIVGEFLRERFDTEPEVDDDGDFVIDRNRRIWIRVHDDQPAVEILACVTPRVATMRSAAIEVGILNRDHHWVKWTLRGKSVWQSVLVPGLPFVPHHLDSMLTGFMHAFDRTRDDLILRTGAQK
ncbi:hypothetical protein [Williamsia sp. CHRR-6]|uniref:TY-Chap domain-containing protein n=1 Tax=Williamsia sp. CHRR-6 TaxID=2835871 RepID=UPI001BDB3574|nr:hypothetical protein [Williamsia sp. CHRR-6]MBT0566168.1 hypothetical protein [Williamsia sp. CHRR-6]